MFFVERREKRVTLHGPEGKYSIYSPRMVFTGMGWDAQSASALLVGRVLRHALVLGFGGGTAARQLRAMFPRTEIIGVEIDAQIVKIGRTHFATDQLHATVITTSGEAFVRRCRRRLDFILDDMWDHERRMARAIATEGSWPHLVARRLTPDGVYAVNIFGPDHDAATYLSIFDRMRRAFSSVAVVSLPGERVVVVAGSQHVMSLAGVDDALDAMPVTFRSALRKVEFVLC